MSAHITSWASATSQSMSFHTSCCRVVRRCCPGVRFAGCQPIQSLYLLIVRMIVGLPDRHATTLVKSSSNSGLDSAADVVAQSSSTSDQSESW